MAIRRILQWQKKSGASLITAAALTLSVLISSQQTLDTYVRPTHLNQPEVHTLQKSQEDSLATRGGITNVIKKKKAVVKKETPIHDAMLSTSRSVKSALNDLAKSMKGSKSDTLLLLLATSFVTPFCKKLGLSPILGFLATGMLTGPYGLGLIKGIHSIEHLAEIGIVFFLFEMGIELSVDKLISMKQDVFGLGLSQFLLTSAAIAGAGSLLGLPANALVVLGGGIALSSSAFVLQLLKDTNQLSTRYGQASFGVLLLQDLAVVPLLVVTPILAGGGAGLGAALGSAGLKFCMAVAAVAAAGRFLLKPFYKTVSEANSKESFLGLVLLTVLSMSFLTEGLGLSNTLGAFLAGVLLSETKYNHKVEHEIAPFRAILLGFFFVTVGFEIDLGLIMTKFPQIMAIVVGIISIKTAVATALCLAFGLKLPAAQQAGLLLSQGGEFAFVAFGLARSVGILDSATTKILLTSVSLTMALTPSLAQLGSSISNKLGGDVSDAIETTAVPMETLPPVNGASNISSVDAQGNGDAGYKFIVN
jgi:monovalent cation:H+ antiporter-2, CPA2 family